MSETPADLRKEQQAALARPEPHYSLLVSFLAVTMDLVAGREPTLGKIKFLEILANIPYRAWERRLGSRLKNSSNGAAQSSRAIVEWTHEAIANENWHLQLAEAKMRADGVKDPWYLSPLMRIPVLLSYGLGSWFLAWTNIRRAYLINAEFEDHAEHSYARFVANNPQFEQESAANAPLQGFPELKTWADVFRRLGLDERNHRNHSYTYAGKPELAIPSERTPSQG